MTVQARQSTESRQAEIIATMIALAAERNPAEITTTDIAKAMQVTQGALFRHFPTKEAIRLAVIESIEAPRNAQSGQGLVIPIRFVEIKSATVNFSTKVPTRPPSKGAVQDVGTKAPAVVKPDLVQKTGALGTLEQVGKVAKTVIGR